MRKKPEDKHFVNKSRECMDISIKMLIQLIS
nr:hypothetical protein SHINE37_60022 [Rhizobiaceae bacterium]